MVVFILKNRSSLNQTVSPPNTTTSTAVNTCIRLILPVSHQSTAMEARGTGTKAAAATMKPSYSVPPMREGLVPDPEIDHEEQKRRPKLEHLLQRGVDRSSRSCVLPAVPAPA